MSLRLLIQDYILRRPLKVGDKEFKINALTLPTSPAFITTNDYLPGYTVANRDELLEFLQKFKPADWMQLYAIDPEIRKGLFGPVADVFKTNGDSIEGVNSFFVKGLPRGTLILFVKNKVK